MEETVNLLLLACCTQATESPDPGRRGYAVTRDRIYYFRREAHGHATLRSLTPATGQNAPIATITKTLHLGLTVAPDRTDALFTLIDREGSNLLLVEEFH